MEANAALGMRLGIRPPRATTLGAWLRGMSVTARPSALCDTIAVRGLEVRMVAGLDAWDRPVVQPVQIDALLGTDIARAGRSDFLPHSLNYGEVYRALEGYAREHSARALIDVAEGAARTCLFACHAPWAEVHVRLPRALLAAAYAGARIVRSLEDYDGEQLRATSAHARDDRLVIEGLEVFAVLGVNPWERENKQCIRIRLEIWGTLRYKALVRSIAEHVEASSFQTIEALATSIAELALRLYALDRIGVRVEKPSAIMFAESAGVEIVRERGALADSGAILVAGGTHVLAPAAPSAVSHTAPGTASSVAGTTPWHSVALALGSNLGDRLAHINVALDRLTAHPHVRLIDTSFLYETLPMYYSDQPVFLNGACKIATTLTPHELLALTQAIEVDVGRVKAGVPRNGPRVVDVDILLYDDAEVRDGEHLIVPHPRIRERAFVLHPLRDIIPHTEHPVLQRTTEQMLQTLTHTSEYVGSEFCRVLPLADRVWRWGERTLVMGILNATPDSFSNGGEHLAVDVALSAARAMAAAGVDVLDVGGQSTAPGRPEVPLEEEAARVLPLIAALRADPATRALPISIDTYRADVARQALDAGASIVNDVSGGTRDPAMLPLVAARQCPCVLMHMRGDAASMTRHTTYTGGVVADVAVELSQCVDAALRAGVRRWNIVLDPGIGFAKDTAGNVALLRDLSHITGPGGSRGGLDPTRHAHVPTPGGPAPNVWAPNPVLCRFPLLLGVSRKRFLGQLIRAPETEPARRDAASLAACVAAIASGAVDIVRVHDVQATVDAVRTADTIVR